MGKKYDFKVCGATDTGLVRSNNEDSYLIDRESGLFMVADGLGGHAAGETASKYAVNTVAGFLKQRLIKNPKEKIVRTIMEAIQSAHRTVLRRASLDPAFSGMGTTLVTLFCRGNKLYLANVGDSRAYLFRKGRLSLLSQDHSLVAEMVKKGLLTNSQARFRSERNIVTRAIGIEPFGKCHQKQIIFKDKDLILLCSDGLWDMLSDDQISRIIAVSQGGEKLCQDLINAAKSAGGKDNITVVAVQVERIPVEKKVRLMFPRFGRKVLLAQAY